MWNHLSSHLATPWLSQPWWALLVFQEQQFIPPHSIIKMSQIISHLIPWVPLVIVFLGCPELPTLLLSSREEYLGQRTPTYCNRWNHSSSEIMLWAWEEAIVRVILNFRMCLGAGGADICYSTRKLTKTGMRELT